MKKMDKKKSAAMAKNIFEKMLSKGGKATPNTDGKGSMPIAMKKKGKF